jgi:hypothetical protein
MEKEGGEQGEFDGHHDFLQRMQHEMAVGVEMLRARQQSEVSGEMDEQKEIEVNAACAHDLLPPHRGTQIDGHWIHPYAFQGEITLRNGVKIT